MRKAVNTVVQYEILNPHHHCGAGQEEGKELASSKFVQRTRDNSQKLVKFLVGEEKGACCELHILDVFSRCCSLWGALGTMLQFWQLQRLVWIVSETLLPWELPNVRRLKAHPCFSWPLSSSFTSKESIPSSVFVTQASMKQLTKAYWECRCCEVKLAVAKPMSIGL